MSSPRPDGPPAFPNGLPFVRPAVAPLARVVARLAPSYNQGILTNGPLVAEFEEIVADRLGVGHAVAVASCTSGLILASRAVGLSGPTLIPSFTFSASAHSVVWAGATPRFIECDPDTFLADIGDAQSQLDGIGGAVITHTFGAPAAPERWVDLAQRTSIPLVFDAAHGFGSRRGGKPVGGFGDAEVFSLTPTKPVIAGEGGIVTTNREDVAEYVRLGREYGNPGDYDTQFVGLNARMSEFHAACALESLVDYDENLARRKELAARACVQLVEIPGVRVQTLDPADESTWKDLTIAVDTDAFGATRDELVAWLRADGIDTRKYFDPPVHRQKSHSALVERPLPMTDAVARSVASLPVYPSLADADVDRVISVIGDAFAANH